MCSRLPSTTREPPGLHSRLAVCLGGGSCWRPWCPFFCTAAGQSVTWMDQPSFINEPCSQPCCLFFNTLSRLGLSLVPRDQLILASPTFHPYEALVLWLWCGIWLVQWLLGRARLCHQKCRRAKAPPLGHILPKESKGREEARGVYQEPRPGTEDSSVLPF
jgi:hypothetical protein